MGTEVKYKRGKVMGTWRLLQPGTVKGTWLCQCVNHPETVKPVKYYTLSQAKGIRCTCAPPEAVWNGGDLSGKKVGNWNVLYRIRRTPYWACECTCEKKTRRAVRDGVLRKAVGGSRCKCDRGKSIEEIEKGVAAVVGRETERDPRTPVSASKPEAPEYVPDYPEHTLFIKEDRLDMLYELKQEPATPYSEEAYASYRKERPKTRADCVGGERPCPWVSCEHHLYLEVNKDSGVINRRRLPVWEMPQTCVLDIVESGNGEPVVLEVVGELYGVTKQRAQQVEEEILAQPQVAKLLKDFRDMIWGVDHYEGPFER